MRKRIKNDLLVWILKHEGGGWSLFTDTGNWDRVTDGRGTMRKEDSLWIHLRVEIVNNHPNKDVKQAIAYRILEFE